MTEGRIYFTGNPWPEGHPIKNFVLDAILIDGDVWLGLQLETENYDSEREIPDQDEYASDWNESIVWTNFHRCRLSSSDSSRGAFKVCSEEKFNADFLDGLVAKVNPELTKVEDFDALAFHIYLMGHDAVACHEIKFTKNTADLFDINWTGKIALTYCGEYDFNHDFIAVIKNVPFPIPRARVIQPPPSISFWKKVKYWWYYNRWYIVSIIAGLTIAIVKDVFFT